MKLALCYTVFDGLELLPASIKAMRKHVDEIIICFQKVSFTNQISDVVEAFCYGIQQANKNVHVIEYHLEGKCGAKQNERNKHNLMVNKAKALGCTHAMLSATDHFYLDSQVNYAKNVIAEADYDCTFTKMYTYYKYPTWRLSEIEEYHMPFIFKLYADTQIVKLKWKEYPVFVDPSVHISTYENHTVFTPKEIMLHHFSMVRRDVREKLSNAASSWQPHEVDQFIKELEGYDITENPGVSYFKGKKIEVVPDYFGLCAYI
jgi:hypothetical protein